MTNTGKSPLDIVLGLGNVGDKSRDPMARYDTPDEVNAFIDAFAARGYRQLDTAQIYSPNAPGTSEPRVGAVNAGERFTIDSKVYSHKPGDHATDTVLKNIDASLEALKVKQINIQYLHRPERTSKLEEPCKAMNQAHKEGKIKHWGISNYTAAETQQILDICDENGWVRPSVYQGQYNPLVRGGEKELFPILRKYGIAFYAYSAAGAGFFAGNHKNVQAGGRYDTKHGVGKMYAEIYLIPAVMEATEKALAVASEHDIGGHAAALRWTAYHSTMSKEHGDAIILGASSAAQLNSNIDMMEEGPLPAVVVEAMDRIWEEIGEADQPSYHM